MRSWVDFWNAEHSIYVNERHKQLHAEAIGRDILSHVPRPDAVVLDHGCGEALYAEQVAIGCGRLILCDAAPRVREALARRLAGVGNTEVIEPAGVAAIADDSLDLVVANSLLQYLAISDLESLLDQWRAKLNPAGALVVADVIPPGVSPFTDASALLAFAARGSFLVPAVGGLVRTALSDYGRIRKALGFSMYREAEMTELMARHSLDVRRVYPNFGHNQARMTFRATKVRSLKGR